MDKQKLFFNQSWSPVSWDRCISQNGFNMRPPTSEMLGLEANTTNKEFNMFLMMSLAEELGEIAGAMKKIIRGFNARELKKQKKKYLEYLKAKDLNHEDIVEAVNNLEFGKFTESKVYQEVYTSWVKDRMAALKSECADFQIYFDLFLSHNGINIHEAIRNTFNKVSEEMNCPQFKI